MDIDDDGTVYHVQAYSADRNPGAGWTEYTVYVGRPVRGRWTPGRQAAGGMSIDEINRLASASIRLLDRRIGVLVRWPGDDGAAGFQVPGERELRWIPVSRLHDRGFGALEELAVGQGALDDTHEG